MITTVISSAIAPGAVIGAVVVGYILFLIIREITYDNSKPLLASLGNSIKPFMLPLVILFGYTVVLWGAKILTA